MLAALRRAQEIGQVRIGADLEQVVSAMIGTFYADHLAGRDVDDGWSTRVVEALLEGVAGPAYTRRE